MLIENTGPQDIEVLCNMRYRSKHHLDYDFFFLLISIKPRDHLANCGVQQCMETMITSRWCNQTEGSMIMGMWECDGMGL